MAFGECPNLESVRLDSGNSSLASIGRVALNTPMEITLELLPGAHLRAYLESDLPEGVEIARMSEGLLHRDFGDGGDLTVLVIRLAEGVAAGAIGGTIAQVAGNWIWEKFKKRPPKKTTIRKREITWDKGELIRVIEEELKVEEGGDSDEK